MTRHSTVTVSNIWVEDLFQWFFDSVFGDGGDGAGAIVCKNYEEAAEFFLLWYGATYGKDFYLRPSKTKDMVHFHRDNESYIFTNNQCTKLWVGEYVFHVSSPCYSYKDVNQENALYPATEIIGCDSESKTE